MRDQLTEHGATPCAELADENRWKHGRQILVAGMVLVRQRPGTASGIIFCTIEDEEGVANLIIRPDVYEQYRRALRHSVAVLACGRVERQGSVVHVLVQSTRDLRDVVAAQEVRTLARNFH